MKVIFRGSFLVALFSLLMLGAAGASRVEAQTDAPTRWVVAPEGGSEARYRVREQLAGFEFPNDAVGSTSTVTGTLVLAANGAVLSDGSRFEIDLTTLQSDESRRDNYLRRNTLNTEEHPKAIFVPTAIRGLASPLPGSAETSFELIGDLTVRGVTRPVTWAVTATFDGAAITGQARTEFTFDRFELTKPRLIRLLSVADEIRLEYDFRLVRAEAEG